MASQRGVLLAGFIVSTLVAGTACGSSSSGSSTKPAKAAALRVVNRRAAALGESSTGSVAVPRSDQDMLSGVGGGGVWVVDYAANEVVRIDPQRARVAAVIRGIRQPCGAMVFGGGSAWVPLCGSSATAGIARIDAGSNHVRSVDLRGRCCSGDSSIAFGGGRVWVAAESPDLTHATLYGLAPKTDAVLDQIRLPSDAVNVAYGAGSVWVGSPRTGTVLRIDPNSKQATSIRLPGCSSCSEPGAIVASDGAMWEALGGLGVLARIDQATNHVTVLPTRVFHTTIAASPSAVRLSGDGVPLIRVDTHTDAVTRWVGSGGDAVSAGYGAVWLANTRFDHLLRIPYTALAHAD